MSNRITIELCDEDRARIDRLTAALEARQSWDSRNCQACVEKVIEATKTGLKPVEPEEPKDDLEERLATTIKEAAEFVGADRTKPPTEPKEAPTPTDTPKTEEKPTDEEKTDSTDTNKATHADVKSLYIKLAANGKREAAKAIIMPVSTTISGIPEDKLQEIYKKLVALEG